MPQKAKAPITRVEVAAAAGVSVFTVSLVMRGMAGVAPATRERVQQAAQKLGYQANPMAAMLAHQRQRKKTALPNIAILDEKQYGAQAAKVILREQGFEALVRRPSQFASPEAAARQLWQEGVVGILLDPHKWPWSREATLRFDWSRFAVVKLSRLMPYLPVHLIRHSPFDYIEETVSRVVGAGYKRIGVVMLQSTGSPRDDDARWGVLLNWSHRKLPLGASLRWFCSQELDWRNEEKAIQTWIAAEPLDALILYTWYQYDRLVEICGKRFASRTPTASILTNPEPGSSGKIVTGCDIRNEETITRACQLIQAQLIRGERGFPSLATEHVIEPVWVDGETLTLGRPPSRS